MKKYVLFRSQFKLLLLFFFLSIATAYGQMGGMDMASSGSTSAKRPLTVNSNESTKAQLLSARAEGNAVDSCVRWVLQQSPAQSGQVKAGEYLISCAVSQAEGWYNYNNNKVVWQDAANANAHVWVFVQDGADGRIVPPLNIRLIVQSKDGKTIEQKVLPYALMPMVNGYGENISLPGNGSYQIKIEIEPPLYRRHDPYNGDRFTQPVTAIIPINFTEKNNGETMSALMENNSSLSAQAGNAYHNTLKIMYKQANDGRDTVTGDYFIAYALEYSEGYWYSKDSKLVYKSDNEMSSDHNAHLEIVARDLKTGRFMHGLNVTATLFDLNKKKIDTKMEMFMWHPWLYHYGENWRVPKAGSYYVHIHIDAPADRRYGKNFGKQFTMPADIDFPNIKIKTGQK